ncbi:MAG: hypothetical protein R3B05_02770 [Nitrospira sp.]
MPRRKSDAGPEDDAASAYATAETYVEEVQRLQKEAEDAVTQI